MARWDGTQWTALGDGLRVIGLEHDEVLTLAHDGTYLYAGGNFRGAGGQDIPYLARWDGMAWEAVGGGVDDTVTALHVSSDRAVYASGNFTQAGEAAANRVAGWDGTAWSSLGEGLNNSARALAMLNGDLYVGGFNILDDPELGLQSVARWNGTSWEALAEGIGSVVFALEAVEDRLYVGGSFSEAGNQEAPRVAVWDPSLPSGNESIPDHRATVPVLDPPYPNPNQGDASITFHLEHPGRVTVAVYDILGRRVATLLDRVEPGGSHQIVWLVQDLRPGIYFVHLQANGSLSVQPVIVTR